MPRGHSTTGHTLPDTPGPIACSVNASVTWA